MCWLSDQEHACLGSKIGPPGRFQPCGSCLYLNCSSCSLCDSVCGKQLFLKVYRQQVLGTVCIFFDSFVQKRNPRAFLEDPLSLVSLSCVLPWWQDSLVM